MARADGWYSQVIAWLKILLPLVALALLSTIFLLSRSADPVSSVPFADALEQGEIERENVTAPYYAGTTARGDILTMTARSARPEGAGRILAETLEARLQLADGSEIRLDAGSATLRDEDRRARLEGGVQVASSNGYTLTTDVLITGLDAVEAESEGPVAGEGPAGTLEAGKMRIVPSESGEDVQMLFTDGVKMVYQPRKEKDAAP
ncbi:LPS export ABC transporter periplasmic protein LptC [Pseudoponticoccus marisrubri]|uniref:LPS export ABC transporter periplasmic protein LptC n=1 Tax=Pseudoponticoccus marisrubri TaxID=1685382 RepID=A0A0W7WJ52_9RHOB|nr:LPS export ABC transporter periplasmic protein LptC [Pseudoponticoccus marisrubri]KUF10656.1 hypothetical protein AVJ23_12350 [Pseudoponticoccus marisrubri]